MVNRKKGQGRGESKSSPKQIERRKAIAIALDLRYDQVRVTEIRERISKMKWKHWTPWKTDKAVYEALDKATTEIPTPNAIRLRNEIDEGISAILRVHLDKATSGRKSTRSAEIALKAYQKRIDLYGLKTILMELKGEVDLALLVPDGWHEEDLPEFKEEE